MLGRGRISEAIRDGAEKAGALVGTALAVACVALLVAVAALVMAVRGRRVAAA